ncbi:MAG TPA: hypothetical protein VFQ80_09115, partial [Thermomicrobiales bacterium]|nr:hypothetical protein [Thermomicrobiales bacterium]
MTTENEMPRHARHDGRGAARHDGREAARLDGTGAAWRDGGATARPRPTRDVDTPPDDAARDRSARPWLLVTGGVLLAALGLLASLHGLNFVAGQAQMTGRLAWVVAG